MEEIVVREVKLSEIDEAIALAKAGLKERLGSLVIVDFSDFINFEDSYLSEGAKFYIAMWDGQIVGTCGVSLLRGKVYKLTRLSVAAAFRTRGISKLLMDKAEAFAEMNGGEYTYLSVNKTWDDAIAIYEQRGYQRTEEDEVEYYMIRKI